MMTKLLLSPDETENKRLKQVFRNIINRSKSSKYPFNVIFSEDSFIKWYINEKNRLQNKCTYCGSDQYKISELIHVGIHTNGEYGLFSKRFINRGHHLEVDRMNPCVEYSERNCCLICYFCNNDKSDIYTSDIYRKYFIDITSVDNKTLRKHFIDDMYELLTHS